VLSFAGTQSFLSSSSASATAAGNAAVPFAVSLDGEDAHVVASSARSESFTSDELFAPSAVREYQQRAAALLCTLQTYDCYFFASPFPLQSIAWFGLRFPSVWSCKYVYLPV
jgi:hypothetical protein